MIPTNKLTQVFGGASLDTELLISIVKFFDIQFKEYEITEDEEE